MWMYIYLLSDVVHTIYHICVFNYIYIYYYSYYYATTYIIAYNIYPIKDDGILFIISELSIYLNLEMIEII